MKSPLRPATCATPEPTCRELNEEPSLGPESSPEKAGRAAGFAVVPMEMARDRRLKTRHHAVLLALYLHYNAKTNKPVYPSRRRLSELTGLHLSTVSAVTSELVALGWITKSGKGGFCKSTRYSLNIAPTPRPVAADASVAPQATLAKEAIQSPRHSGDTPSSPLSRLDLFASLATRKEQSKGTEEWKNFQEEVSAREKLARGLVEYFISSFQGLGTVTIPKDTSPVWKKWEDEFLSLLDAGAMYREIKTAISWLVDENRRRTEFRFIVTDPAELRKKWPKLLDAVSKDRADDILNFIDETPAETRIRRQKAYAFDLIFTVPTDDYEHEEDIALGRLLDPRNRIPAPIAFCVCVERCLVGGLHLEKEFQAALKEDMGLLGTYHKLFPDLSQERVKELRLSEQGNYVDDVHRGADEQPQSPGPT